MSSKLQEIDTLVGNGRVLDAIDALTLLATTAPEPALDQRLVKLRNLAVSELRDLPGREQWPPLYNDSFADESDIPTIRREQLSSEAIGGGVTHHGCLRVDGLIDDAMVGELRSLIDSVFAQRERDPDDPPAPDDQYVPFGAGKSPRDGFANKVFVRVSDVPLAMRRLERIFAEIGLKDAVAGYFGERPTMIADKWVLRRSPHGGVASDYHQDGAFLGEGIRTVNCWIALSDCGPGTGRPSMDLVPRRFPLLDAGVDAIFKWSLNPDTVESSMPGTRVVTPVFAAGDALIFDERLPHRTQVGPDLDRRYAIESWFVAPSSYPTDNLSFVL